MESKPQEWEIAFSFRSCVRLSQTWCRDFDSVKAVTCHEGNHKPERIATTAVWQIYLQLCHFSCMRMVVSQHVKLTNIKQYKYRQCLISITSTSCMLWTSFLILYWSNKLFTHSVCIYWSNRSEIWEQIHLISLKILTKIKPYPQYLVFF